MVVDRVADVNVGGEREVRDGGVEVEDVRRLVPRVQVRVDTLHERRLARACPLAVSALLLPCAQHRAGGCLPAIPITMIAAAACVPATSGATGGSIAFPFPFGDVGGSAVDMGVEVTRDVHGGPIKSIN